MTMFSSTFSVTAVTASVDIWEIVAPATGPVVLHRCVIGQTSDVGDAQEEILPVLIKRGQTTSGSGGAPTISTGDLGLTGASFGGTLEGLNTTKATAGTILTLYSDPWNVRGSWDWLPTPETRIWIPASGRATVELAAAPADSITVSSTLIYELV